MAKETTLNELGEMLTHVIRHIDTLATKEDLSVLDRKVDNLQIQVNGIEQQLRGTRTEIRLGNLVEEVFGKARG